MSRRSTAEPGGATAAAGRGVRAGRSDQTREQVLTAAERLFAQHGVVTVSNRQIGEAAGQGNNTVVGYHFGTKADLVRAIVRRHSADMESRRAALLTRYAGSTELRDWVVCLVHPYADHLAHLGAPTWYARFAAQVMTDPALRQIVIDEALTTPTTQAASEGLDGCLSALGHAVRADRLEMVRVLIVHMCAERERALAGEPAADDGTWSHTADALTDAVVGLLRAPVTAG